MVCAALERGKSVLLLSIYCWILTRWRPLNSIELDVDQQEESPVCEILGKLGCLSHAFDGDIGKGEEINEAEMMEQVKRLQDEEAETTTIKKSDGRKEEIVT